MVDGIRRLYCRSFEVLNVGLARRPTLNHDPQSDGVESVRWLIHSRLDGPITDESVGRTVRLL
jgi:hypothetical protein